MSIEEVAAELRRVLGALDLTPLIQSLELIDQGESLVTAAIHGSQRFEAGQAVALLAHTKQQLGQVYQTVTAARQLVEQYLSDLVGGGSATTALPKGSATTSTTSTTKTTKPASGEDKQKEINDILATLPPEVPKPNPSGKKTHGRVVGSNETVISGEDAESDEVWQRLMAAGVPEKFKPMSIDHAEMKVALRMVKSGKKNVELAMNNRPCRGLWSCRALLPILLPEGYTLIVYGPNNYQGTFTGGKKWSS